MSFKKHFGDADEDFCEISCSGKVKSKNIENGQNIIGHIADETKKL